MDDAVFRALADPHRRRLLDALFEQDGRTLAGLVETQPDLTRFGVMKHLRVLESAGLVVTRRVGREKHHYLEPVPIRRIHDRWLDKYRAGAAATLMALQRSVEEESEMVETTTVPAHVFTIFIRATPEAIWRAITESDFTRRYYYASEVESDWRPGSSYRYTIGGADAIVGEVIEADPPRRLVCTFHATWDDAVRSDAPSRISWEIAEEAPGVCRLTVVHDGFAGRTATWEQVGGGMPWILSGLKSLLETGEPLA